MRFSRGRPAKCAAGQIAVSGVGQPRAPGQLQLRILQLVSEHDRLAGEYVQDRVELRKQAKVPVIKAAFLRARKDLPVDGPRLLQNDRRSAQRGDGGGKLIGGGLVGVFAPEVDQNQLSGRNAASFYDVCYGFARHTHTSYVSAILSYSHWNVKSDLINIKINNLNLLRNKQTPARPTLAAPGSRSGLSA